MQEKIFPVIDPIATGENILRLRKERGMTVRDMQSYFGFEEPQAIYKWQKGKTLPSVDNLYALGALLEVPMEQILVAVKPQSDIMEIEQQDKPAARPLLGPAAWGTAGAGEHFNHFAVALRGNAFRRSRPRSLGRCA